MADRRDDVPGSAARYGSLTYTSYDAGGGAGGWQVKQRLDLSDEEAAALRSRVNTQVDGGVEVPRFPTPEDVAGFPRRLLYAPFGSGAAWWHVAPAGSDASGRPGNVFAKVVLDRAPGAERTTRPIELWRSPDWPTPYGVEAVNATELNPGEPVPGGRITQAVVLDFVLDLTTFRLGTLGALLDACAAAMDGGPRVVLIADDVDTAALWIGAVSFLMPVQYAREKFAFSTLERSSGLTAAFSQGVLLCCVPAVDRDAVDQLEGVVVIDEHEDIKIGDVGGQAHQTSRGYAIAATHWSALAQVVLTDAATAAAGIEQMDRLMAGLPSSGYEPGWGLAMMVGQDRDRFADAEVEAYQIIARSSPADLPEDGALFAAASALVNDHLGKSAEDAWKAVASSGRSAASNATVSQMVLGNYVIRALGDVEWLASEFPESVPLPPDSSVGTAVAAQGVEVALATLRDLAANEDIPEKRRGFIVAALTNLVARLQLDSEELREQLLLALERWFIYQLLAFSADELVRRLGRFAETTQAGYLRPLVEDDQALRVGQPGKRLNADVAAWLYPEDPAPVSLSRDGEPENLRLRTELATHRFALNRLRAADERPLIAWSALSEPTTRLDLAPLFANPWPPEELLNVWRRFGSAGLRNEWVAVTLKASPYSETLKELCRQLLVNGWNFDYLHSTSGGSLPDLANLRYVEQESWFTAEVASVTRVVDQVLGGTVYAMSVTDVQFDRGVLHLVAPVAIAGGVLDLYRDHGARIRSALAGQSRVLDAVQQQMLAASLDGRVSWSQLGLAAMVVEEKFPEPALTTPHLAWINTWTVDTEGGPMPALRHYLMARIHSPSDAEELRTYTIAQAQHLLDNRASNPDKVGRLIEKFVTGWVKQLVADQTRLARGRARLS